MKKLLLLSFLLTSSFYFVTACSIVPRPAERSFFESERLLQDLKSDYIKKINSPFNFFELPDLEASAMGSDFDLKFLVFRHDTLKDSPLWTFIWSSGGNCFPLVLYVKTYMIPLFIAIPFFLSALVITKKRKMIDLKN